VALAISCILMFLPCQFRSNVIHGVLVVYQNLLTEIAFVWNSKNWCVLLCCIWYTGTLPFFVSHDLSPGTWDSFLVGCAAFSSSVGFVKHSPKTGLSDDCHYHGGLAVIQTEAFKNKNCHTNACSIQLTLNKRPSTGEQADIKSEQFLSISYLSYED
jgi:hypothetical protein